MIKQSKIQASHVDRLIEQGYCRVSRRHMILSRIDREDWREHMARDHAPWDWKGDGMKWATSNGMADHYRRCYSKDQMQLHPDCAALFLKFPGSGCGPEQFMGKPRWEKAPVPKRPADPGSTSETQPDQVVGTSESQPDLAPGSQAPEAPEVFFVVGGLIGAVWLMVEIIQWLMEKL